MDLTDFIIYPLLMLLFLCIIFLSVDGLTTEVTAIKKVDCVDGDNNKIIGIENLKCEKKINCGIISKYISPNHCYNKNKKEVQ